MNMEDVISTIRRELAMRGSNPYRAATDAGLPATAIRHLLEGRQPKLGRMIEISAALGLEFYVGPPRSAATAERPARSTNVTALRTDAMEPVHDRVLAELIARLADHWEAMEGDGVAQDRLRIIVDAALRGTGERERLALRRVVEWLGWRVIDGTHAAGVSVTESDGDV